MTELPVHYDIYGRRYNFSARNISVRADMGGAEIYELNAFVEGKLQPVLVLAHSEKDAKSAVTRL